MAFFYTDEHLQFLQQHRQALSTKALTAAFNQRFADHKSVLAIKAISLKHGFKTGRTGCFLPGNVPFNKDTVGLIQPNRGSFQKNHDLNLRKPIGSERINPKDKCIIIKTGEPSVWQYKHIVIWETAHGPMPKNHTIRYIDGNQKNCVLENLEIVSKALHLRLNKRHYTTAPSELKPAIKALAKVEVAYFKRSGASHD